MGRKAEHCLQNLKPPGCSGMGVIVRWLLRLLSYHIYSNDDVNAIMPVMCAISYVSYDYQVVSRGAAEGVSASKQ